MKTAILAVHAHPDDIEILAGGTLAALAAAGHPLSIVTMTPGDCGSADLASEAIASVRRQEAAQSTALIGAAYRCAEFRDLAIFSDDPSRRRVVELLRRARPDLVLTASPVDYLCDHEATSQLVRDACFAAPVPNCLTGALDPAPPLPAIPHLYFMDAIGGVDREGRPVAPDFFVDVTARFATKKAMLAQHSSQREWLLRHHGIDDYLELMERWPGSAGAVRESNLPKASGATGDTPTRSRLY